MWGIRCIYYFSTLSVMGVPPYDARHERSIFTKVM